MNKQILFACLAAVLFAGTVKAQERSLFGTHTLYDDMYNPQRTHFIDSNTYMGFSLPVLAGVGTNIDFNGPFWQFVDRGAFKNDSVDNKYLIDNYGKDNYLTSSTNVQLLLLKIRTSSKRKGEFSLAARTNIFVNMNFKTEFLAFPIVGNASFVGKTQNGFFDGDFRTTANVQLSAGYRMNVAKGLGIGFLATMHHSPFYYDTHIENSYFKQNAVDAAVDPAAIEAHVEGSLLVAGTGASIVRQTLFEQTIPKKVDTDELLKQAQKAATSLKNTGMGYSFGADYDLNKKLNLTAGIKNLGWITYNTGGKLYTLNKTLYYSGVGADTASQDSVLKYFTDPKNYAVDSTDVAKFHRYLPTTFVLGASYKLLPFLIARGYINYQVFPDRPIANSVNLWKDFRSLSGSRIIEYTGIADLKLGAFNIIFNYSVNNNNSTVAGLEFVWRSKHVDVFTGVEQAGFASDGFKQTYLKDEYQKYVPTIGASPGVNVNFGLAYRLGRKTRYQRDMRKQRHVERRIAAQNLPVAPSQELLADTMIVDTDADGILDQFDDCPLQKGEIDNHGCPNPDTDGDGVVDKIDLCPDVAGLKERGGCPIPDTDGDGLTDDKDKCPTEKGLADNDGCPLVEVISTPVLDSDGDGVVDSLDKCPAEFGLTTNQGCPEEKKVAVLTREETQVISTVFQNLVFATGKAVIDPVSFESLDKLATLLKNSTKFTILIEGHTDNVGKKKKNIKLSEDRAVAVADYLKAKGVAKELIATKGFGDSRPLTKNDTPEGKAKNRRVEFTVLTKEEKK